jgi:hypothetical protein
MGLVMRVLGVASKRQNYEFVDITSIIGAATTG